jgi:retinol dehydrogenase-12
MPMPRFGGVVDEGIVEVRLGLDHLDVLVNNAGVFSSAYRESADGIELQFAVNHLAAFLLTGELLAHLEAAPRARVICVSSGSHFTGRIHWENVCLTGRYFGLAAYDQSKLAALLFSYELACRLGPSSTVSTYAVDPGLVKTDIAAKGGGPLVTLIWRLRTRKGISPQEAADSIVFLASRPEVEDDTGMY